MSHVSLSKSTWHHFQVLRQASGAPSVGVRLVHLPRPWHTPGSTLPLGRLFLPVLPSDILRAPCLQNSAPAFSLPACWVQSVMLHWLLTLLPSSTVRMKDLAAIASTWRHLQTVVCKDAREACDSAHSSPWVWVFVSVPSFPDRSILLVLGPHLKQRGSVTVSDRNMDQP